MTLQAQPQQAVKNLDELILVIKRTDLFPADAWQGLRQVNFDPYLELIKTKQQFLPRSLMENDPTYKQIIPYLIFQHEDKFFLMQRQAKASETRLQNKYSLGIGGHIRQEDMDGATLFDWARREFHEEVEYQGTLEIEPLGILNDDSNAVGQVHIGFVLLLKGDSPNISIKSELKSGQLITLADCAAYGPHLESWSALVFDQLKAR